LRLRPAVAIIAATLTPFLPTIWYYGGTALSDVPALCAIVAGCAFLLRGGRDPRAYVVGAVLTAVAVGIRPHTIAVAVLPALAGAFALRSFRRVAAAGLLGAVIVAASYGGAMLFSADPPHGYLRQLRRTQQYISGTDSFLSPHRPPLRELTRPIFFEPMRGGDAAKVLVAFAALALLHAAVRRRVEIGIAFVMFLPLALLTWIMLDTSSSARYAVAYVPLYALLAADGIGVVASFARRGENGVAGTLAFIVVALCIIWMLPALRVVRGTNAPVVDAFRWVRANVPQPGPTVYIENELEIFAGYLLRGFPYHVVYERTDIAPDARAGDLLVISGRGMQPDARLFARRRDRVAKLARPFFFEVSVIPLHTMIDFAEGWYGTESDGANVWQWMSGASRTLFPPLPHDGTLSMDFTVPHELLPRPPLVTMTWNGTVIEQSVWSAPRVTKRFTLPSRRDAPNELRITLDVAGNPRRHGRSGDGRDLGLLLRDPSWQ
ncbi:MAG TPA: hypothetical protein VHL59_13225, partial [Thermoanaerobaculia bacterium]|nr:hypothetical protein [Thermoanaerobaculia bacterium]